MPPPPPQAPFTYAINQYSTTVYGTNTPGDARIQIQLGRTIGTVTGAAAWLRFYDDGVPLAKNSLQALATGPVIVISLPLSAYQATIDILRSGQCGVLWSGGNASLESNQISIKKT